MILIKERTVPYLWAIFHLMEGQFCFATEAAARLGWEDGFLKLTLANGMLPDKALHETYRLCQQVYKEGDKARKETLHYFRKSVREQVRLYNAPTCLYELEKLVKQSSFARWSIDDGVRELREYLESDTNGEKVREYLNQRNPPAPRSDAKIEKRIHALEARLEAAPAPPATPPAIHAVGERQGRLPNPNGGAPTWRNTFAEFKTHKLVLCGASHGKPHPSELN